MGEQVWSIALLGHDTFKTAATHGFSIIDCLSDFPFSKPKYSHTMLFVPVLATAQLYQSTRTRLQLW